MQAISLKKKKKTIKILQQNMHNKLNVKKNNNKLQIFQKLICKGDNVYKKV